MANPTWPSLQAVSLPPEVRQDSTAFVFCQRKNQNQNLWKIFGKSLENLWKQDNERDYTLSSDLLLLSTTTPREGVSFFGLGDLEASKCHACPILVFFPILRGAPWLSGKLSWPERNGQIGCV